MSDSPTITRLRCEYLTNPTGIDETQPRLSWLMETPRSGARQIAYRVLVSTSEDSLADGIADLWDSGKVESDRTTHIAYEGIPLQSRMSCHWQVAVWDETGECTTSEPAQWSMGLLKPHDWQAKWITHDPEIIRRDPQAFEGTDIQPGTPPVFRKAIEIPSAVRRAVLYTTALGIVELFINGQTVTADRFVPEWTDYHQRLHYRTFDVTDLIATGENVLGTFLGDGWWTGFIGWQEKRGQYGTLQNNFLAQLEVELESGEALTVGTDKSWQCETGPLLKSDFMMGETYDARRERKGWNQAGFDDSSWLPAIEVTPPRVKIPHFGFSNNSKQETETALPLVAQRNEPVKVVDKLIPVSVDEVNPGTFIYDLGQNISGWIELSISGPAGTSIRLRHGERLNPDGTLYTENLRRADATDEYILNGEGVEVWQPRFTFHGFQYVEITGIDTPLPIEDVRGCVVMSSMNSSGSFECSHPMVNQLWSNILWGQKGNFLCVPTDCPQRDERLGWMGDAQVFLRTAMYNMDVAAFFTKWMNDVIDSQDVDGIFPDVAPRICEGERFVGLDGLGGSAGWADAGVIVPWTMWQVYDDRRVIQHCWDAMVHWMDWLEENNPKGIRCNKLGNNYGDWLCIPADTSFRTESDMKTLLATAFWADDAMKMAEIAKELNKTESHDRFRAMANRVRDAFQAEWLLDDGQLKVETQTAYLLALAFDLLPTEVRPRAAKRLVDTIEQQDWHLSTGFIGIRYLNSILTQLGYADVAYRLLCNEDYPSWLYPVKHGATTIWERWDGWTAKSGFFDPQMNSFNHYSLGSVGEWLYRSVAGIELEPKSPGFKSFVVKPYPDPRLGTVTTSYDSMNGTIESRWALEGTNLTLIVTVPPNTTARVFVPGESADTVMVESRPITQDSRITLLNHEPGFVVCAVGSGRYEFTSEYVTHTLST